MAEYIPGQTFSDVPAGHWAETDLELVYERGMAAGYPDGTFKPDQPQSRIETVVFMARVLRELDAIAAGRATHGDVEQARLSAVALAVQTIRSGIRVTHRFPAPAGEDADPTLVDGNTWNDPNGHVVTIP